MARNIGLQGSSPTLTKETLLGKLPHGNLNEVINTLQIAGKWKDLAYIIPARNDPSKMKFTTQTILVLDANNALGQSAPKAVLGHLLSQNLNVGNVIDLLVKARLYSVADYLHEDVLGLGPAPRLPEDEEKLVGHKVIDTTELPGPPTFISTKPGPTEGDDSPDGCPVTKPVEPCIDHVDDAIIVDMIPGQPYMFKYSALKHMTNDFDTRPFADGGRLIGKGGFGHVFWACLQSGQKLAIKRLDEGNLAQSLKLKQFESEVNLMAGLDHKNVLQVKGYSDDGMFKCVVYPYMSEGSLDQRLTEKSKPLSVAQRLSIGQGVAHGLGYLHSQQLVHRDIKSANILLDADLVAKLGDFGLSRIIDPTGDPKVTHGFTTQVIGSHGYTAPEVVNFKITAKMDVYSYGVVLLEMLTSLPAFDYKRENPTLASHMYQECNDIMAMVDREAGKWDKETTTSIYDVALKCFEDYKKRPQMTDILPVIETWRI